VRRVCVCVSSGARVNYFSRDAPQDVRRDKELVSAQRQPNFSLAAVHKKTSFDLISLALALCNVLPATGLCPIFAAAGALLLDASLAARLSSPLSQPLNFRKLILLCRPLVVAAPVLF
jgi:hypothetical protein